MFGSSRRHRPPNPPLNSVTANPNATMAAASAFMSAANEKSNKTLSSAAAAAALRARPQTPTNVADVQTKRTMRRSASMSSTGSAAAAAAASRSNPRLERRGSSGSMTERTFRSPSPHGPSSAHTKEQRPPVPQIPTSHRRSASSTTGGVGMQNFRTASQKMKTEHPSWYTEPTGDPKNVRTSDAAMRTKSPPSRSDSIASSPQRPDSRSSVNFSYPTAFRAQSPPASPTSAHASRFNSPPPRTPASSQKLNRASLSSVTGGGHDQKMVYDPNSRRMVPKVAVDAAEHYDKGEAERLPGRKKDTRVRREGSHKAKATVARIKGTTVDADAKERDTPKREQPAIPAAPTTEESQVLEQPAIKDIATTSDKGKQKQQADEAAQSSQLQVSDSRSSPPLRQITPNSDIGYTSQTRGKRPSVVQEEPEEVRDEVDIKAQPSQKVLNALDAVPTRQAIFEQPQASQYSSQDKDNQTVEQFPTQPQLPEQDQSPAETAKEKNTLFIENKPVVDLSRESGSVRRSNSNSPARQARFAATPPESLAVRHTPLPRSASPIKSALKTTNSPTRGLSPSDNGSDLPRSRGTSPNQREEPVNPRKKSVRVSFDERTMAMVVGESAPVEETDSHVPPSPQQLKRPWYTNIGRSKKKEFTLEDDEVMKPRPALPSFGSIREKKARGTEERPLVRPHEPAHSPAMPSSPELRPSSPSAPSDAEAPDELSLGPSTDRAIGLTLAKEQALRNEANISRFREPLPPVVTSIEGSGYVSDSTQTSDSEAELASSVADTSDAEPITSTQTTQLESHDNSQNGSTVLEHKTPVNTEVTPDLTHLPPEEVPEITIIQPSPMASQYTIRADASAVPQYFDVPGGFPEDELDANRHTQTTSKKDEPNTANTATPADAIFEPMAHVHPVQPETLPQTTLATTAPVGAEDDNATDESDESIYSDAYEDLSDIDGEGFMSLDAVIESPINKIATSQLHELPGDTPAQANSEELKLQTAKQPPVAARSPEPPRDVNDWELAKIFWRSLTAEKRLQLEQEAMEEAGAEGDREEVALPIRRNNSRKKTAHQKQPEAESQPRHSKPPSSSAPPASADRIHAIYPKPKDKDESLSPAPKSSQIRTTMRGEQSSQSSTGMRKTLRTNAGTGHAGQSSPGSATTQHNKTDHVPSGSRQHQNNKGHTMPITASENAMSKVKPTLQRRGSDASDSSFKRRRATQSGGLAFRSTMRPFSNINSTDATKGSRRFSLRSLSPSGSSFRGSSANNAAGIPSTMMRRTLRSNSLSSQEGKHFSIPFPSLGRFSKAPATKRSKRLSRFGDSSDEDGEGGAPGFRSRFDDSSDEESIRPSSSSHANPLTRGTLRGSVPPSGGFQKSTPVPEVAEDSPDLPDSDDDEMPSPLQSPPGRAAVAARTGVVRSNSEALGTSTLTRSRSGRGGFTTSISAPTMSTKDKRRNSLFSILHRNKRADQTGKIQRAELTESAARRDTKLERDTGLLKDIRGEQPHSPRLQKRASTKQNGSWPLSESQEMQRSSSAGNLGSQDSTSATQRPGPSSRRSTSLALPTTYHEDDDAIVDGLGQKKKKKFGALRRIFRLDD